MLNAEDLVDRLIDAGLAQPEDIIGCTEEEVAHIEKAYGYGLPEAYRSFLLTAGRGAGVLMDDVTAFYPGIINLTSEMREIVGDDNPLPPAAFVFAERLGEWCCFFQLGTGSLDPAVYTWKEVRGILGEPRPSVWSVFEEELMMLEYRVYRSDDAVD